MRKLPGYLKEDHPTRPVSEGFTGTFPSGSPRPSTSRQHPAGRERVLGHPTGSESPDRHSSTSPAGIPGSGRRPHAVRIPLESARWTDDKYQEILDDINRRCQGSEQLESSAYAESSSGEGGDGSVAGGAEGRRREQERRTSRKVLKGEDIKEDGPYFDWSRLASEAKEARRRSRTFRLSCKNARFIPYREKFPQAASV